MPKVNAKADGGSSPVFADILGLTGMTLAEAQAYLASVGQEYSIHSMKSWTRGSYTAPAEALDAVYAVFLAMIGRLVEDQAPYLPKGVSETTRSRTAAINGVHEWYKARHPEID